MLIVVCIAAGSGTKKLMLYCYIIAPIPNQTDSVNKKTNVR